MSPSKIYDDRICALGEGPLWHPTREQLFWFDILGKQLLSRDDTGALSWQFKEHVSAAGWVDDSKLLIASETALSLFDITTGHSEHLLPLEADNPVTRSNDGRADPWGGFWIGTMGKQAEPGAGAIYRYYKGECRRLFGDITISNAICFAPDGACAYFCDTAQGQIQRQRLGSDGWPLGEPSLFLDCRAEGLNPDGAVVDATGNLWNAQWGAARVAIYSPDGVFLDAIPFPASQISCPAFGGADMTTLFATSARVDLAPDSDTNAGMTFQAKTDVAGQKEHQVIL